MVSLWRLGDDPHPGSPRLLADFSSFRLMFAVPVPLLAVSRARSLSFLWLLIFIGGNSTILEAASQGKLCFS